MKLTLHHRNSKTRWSKGQDDRMRKLQRVVNLAETELLKIKDNLKLTQEILPRHSPRQFVKPDNAELLKKLNIIQRPPILMTSSEEYLKTISERTEVEVTTDSFVFNVNVVPCRSVTNPVDVPSVPSSREKSKKPSPRSSQQTRATMPTAKVKVPIKYIFPKRKSHLRCNKSPKNTSPPDRDRDDLKLTATNVSKLSSSTSASNATTCRRTSRARATPARSRDSSAAGIRALSPRMAKNEDLKELLKSAKSVVAKNYLAKQGPNPRISAVVRNSSSVKGALPPTSPVVDCSEGQMESTTLSEKRSKENIGQQVKPKALCKQPSFKNCSDAKDSKSEWSSKLNVRKQDRVGNNKQLVKPNAKKPTAIESLTFTESCQHLRFNYTDTANSILKSPNLEVYIANNLDNQSFPVPRNTRQYQSMQQSRKTSPPCFCRNRPNYSSGKQQSRIKVTTCNNYGVRNTCRKRSDGVFANCRPCTLPGVCIQSQCCRNQRVINLHSSSSENLNAYLEQQQQQQQPQQQSGGSTGCKWCDEYCEGVCCRGPRSKESSIDPPYRSSLKKAQAAETVDVKHASVENQTVDKSSVDKANSPISTARADLSIQAKASQRNNGVETMLVTDIPSRRTNERTSLDNDDQIQLLFNCPGMASTTDASDSDDYSRGHKPCPSCELLMDESKTKKKVNIKKNNVEKPCPECSSCDLALIAAASREQFTRELFDESDVCPAECTKCQKKVKDKEKEKDKECRGKRCPNRMDRKLSLSKKKKSEIKCSCKKCELGKIKEVKDGKEGGKDGKEVKEVPKNCACEPGRQRQVDTPTAQCCCKCCTCCLRRKKKTCTKDNPCANEKCSLRHELVKHDVNKLCKECCHVVEPGGPVLQAGTSPAVSSSVAFEKSRSEVECLPECRKKIREEITGTTKQVKKGKECPVLKDKRGDRSYVKIAFCSIENTLPREKQDNDDASIATSIDKYIMVNDVSAQAEFSERDDWERSFEALMNETCKDPLVDKPASAAPADAKQDANSKQSDDDTEKAPTSQKVRVLPFSPSFMQSIQHHRLSRTVQSFSIPPGTKQMTRLKSASDKEGKLGKRTRTKLSMPEKKNLMKFDWKLMRRKKLSSPVKSQRGGTKRHQSTSSEGEINCECSLSLGEIHPCKQGANGGRMPGTRPKGK